MYPSSCITKENIEKINKFQVRDDDVYLIGFPKTGTTWCQELIWLIGNDLDYKKSASTFVDERFPILELFSYTQASEINAAVQKEAYHEDSLKFIENLKCRRFIKSHFSGSLLPQQIQDGTKKPKIIYVIRNPKDTCVSFYCFLKDVFKFDVDSFEKFCDDFISGRVHANLFWDHALYFWNRKNESNILLLTYENMKKDLSQVVRQVATFLDKQLDADEIKKLTEWLGFEAMKQNNAVNHTPFFKVDGFIRKGKVDGFKEVMSEELIRKFDVWTQDCLKGSKLETIYN